MLKRKLSLILLAFVTITSSVACARVQTNSPSNVADNSQPSVKTTSPVNVPDNSNPSVEIKKEVSLNSAIEPYLGTWIIKKYVPTGRVEGFSKKNANDYLGEKIIVNENQIITYEGTIINPKFVKTILTNTEFFSKWNINYNNAGMTGSSVTEINISNFNIRNGTEDRIGSNFIVTIDNTIYTFIGGALFKLGKN